MTNGTDSPEQGGPQQLGGGNGEDDSDRVNNPQHRRLPDLREEGPDDQHVNGQPRPATHERQHQDGHQAIPAVFQSPRGHDRRHRAAEAHQHGDEALSMQADLVHEPIHDERRPGHVAAVFQKRDGEKQQQDDRQEDQDVPTPAMIPSVKRDFSKLSLPAGHSPAVVRPSQSTPACTTSANGLPKLNVTKKTTNIEAAKMGRPRKRLVTTESI